MKKISGSNEFDSVYSFDVGDYARLGIAIVDEENHTIFPPPTIVQIVEIVDIERGLYNVKVPRDKDLPEELQNKQFRAVVSKAIKNSETVTFVGEKLSFFDGDDAIDPKYFEEISLQWIMYLRPPVFKTKNK